MSEVIIYTKNNCIFCDKAKKILENNKIKYIEKNIGNDINEIAEMSKKSNQKTFPQIFVNDKHLGNCSQIQDLANQDQLASKIAELSSK